MDDMKALPWAWRGGIIRTERTGADADAAAGPLHGRPPGEGEGEGVQVPAPPTDSFLPGTAREMLQRTEEILPDNPWDEVGGMKNLPSQSHGAENWWTD